MHFNKTLKSDKEGGNLSNSEVILEMKGICKEFPGVRALIRQKLQIAKTFTLY